MSQPESFDLDALLLAYSTGELSPGEEQALFEAAAADQDLFDLLMDSEALRHALSVPEERRRASAVLQAWGQQGAGGTVTDSASAAPSETLPYAALEGRSPRHSPALLKDLWRSVVSTLATTLALRVCYAVITAIGSSFVATHIPFAETPELGVPPVPSILHLVHAAIAALLLAVQFTPFLKPQTIAEREHPIARKCLAQFIAGWRWAWAAWLALYGWLWIYATSGGNPYPVADLLNCLTSFPLFWCFLVLDKPSVSVPGHPERNAAFRKAVGTTWGIGAGVAVLAYAGRLHLWGLNEFGLVFMGIYDGLAIAFLVGRFDSHWMKVPRWMLAPLYGYALIQMIYVFFFKLPPEWQVYTYLVALLFKICLFLVVTHLLHAGNLKQYLEAAEDGKLGPQN
jgi:hypothetical protein